MYTQEKYFNNPENIRCYCNQSGSCIRISRFRYWFRSQARTHPPTNFIQTPIRYSVLERTFWITKGGRISLLGGNICPTTQIMLTKSWGWMRKSGQGKRRQGQKSRKATTHWWWPIRDWGAKSRENQDAANFSSYQRENDVKWSQACFKGLP